MSKHPVTNILPPLIDDERFSSNGMVPNSVLMKRLAEGFNFVSSRCKKQVQLKCQPLDAVEAGGAIALVWPVYFRTGENTTGLRVALGLARTDYAFSFGSAPQANLTITTAAGAGAIDEDWTLAVSASGTDVAPDDLANIEQLITGLSPNTEYKGGWTLTNGARLVYASIVEADARHADDSVTAVCDPGEFMAEGPIYDSHVADLVQANNELWQHSGAHLINWCAPYTMALGPEVTSTTYVSAIDGVSTTVTGATPGWKLFTQYHNTINRTTVPVKLAIRTDRTAGTGTLDIKLTDGTNTITITGIGDVNDWSTTTANIPAQAGTKWDLHCLVSDGSTTFRIHGLALFEYEA